MGKKLSSQKNLLKILVVCFILALCFCGNKTFAATQVIKNDTFWKDTSGNTIYSQGGGILKVGDTYYWYGVKYNGAVTYAQNPTKKNGDTSFNAVTCYSSKDLVNWKFENNILTSKGISKLAPGWIGRLGVTYNKNTKKYVLISQYYGNQGTGELFATCDTPNGNFAFNKVQTQLPGIASGSTGDQTVFTDTDGKAYLICSSSKGRGNLYVAPLRESDYLSVENATRIFGGVGREGNCMFKYNGQYYFCSSDLHGWNASHCYYIKASNIFGPYSKEEVMTGTDNDFCHVSQTGFFVNVTGTSGTTVLFCGDRWSDFARNGIGYNQWCPVSFNGTTPYFNSVSEFNLNASTGTWSVGAGDNYVLNPSFEADRISSTTLAGWTNWTNLSSGSPNSNSFGAYSGNFCMQQSYASAYKASMYQDLTGLSNGTYTLKAWVKSSGGQNTCQIFAKNFGGAQKNYAINKTIGQWTEITISNINVTNGKCQIGIYSDAKGGNWCKVDNFSLTKN
ncbi:family 43 glycosylhydrolase [Clostridium felsineum]|uniref:Uncharacterized protein n=1 Tax=Clostridium felsineum TaxID=36839 RepID=A0A1S8LAN9_9CLOT|nr:family 43 glycosylhydrolase [Clostridium felsineum]URZ05993.1 hypothetical protein CLROS_013250 [Clostridium felsineum]URZ11030.1 hypothetical protein CROST_017460 [Clostridium felsineum]